MLLGCCHCEKESSSSSSSESSSSSISSDGSSSSGSSDGSSSASSSREIANCSACAALPLRWRVSGVNRSHFNFTARPQGYPTGDNDFVDCPATFDTGEPLELVYLHPSGTPVSGTPCAIWGSGPLINHAKYWWVDTPVVNHFNPWTPSCQLTNTKPPAGVNAFVERRMYIRMRKVGAGYPGTQINLQVVIAWGIGHTNPQTAAIGNTGVYYGVPPYNTGMNFTLTGRNCIRNFVLPGPYDISVPGPNYVYQSNPPGGHPVTISPG